MKIMPKWSYVGRNFILDYCSSLLVCETELLSGWTEYRDESFCEINCILWMNCIPDNVFTRMHRIPKFFFLARMKYKSHADYMPCWVHFMPFLVHFVPRMIYGGMCCKLDWIVCGGELYTARNCIPGWFVCRNQLFAKSENMPNVLYSRSWKILCTIKCTFWWIVWLGWIV
jgi:hypothetical protein